MRLYELTQNYNDLISLSDDPEVPEEMLKKSLDGINEAIEIKAENICKLIKNIEADIKGFKEEEKRLASRRRTLENRVNNLKDYLNSSMNAVGNKKIKGSIFTISIQSNPPSVNITDLNAIDRKYFISQEPLLDKKLILKDLKKGLEVKGVALKQDKSLRIR